MTASPQTVTVLDNAPTTPTVANSSPSLNSQYGIKPPTLNFSSTDIFGDSGVSSFTYSVNNGTSDVISSASLTSSRVALTDSLGTYQSSSVDLTTLPSGAKLPSGYYTISVTATNYSGNISPVLSTPQNPQKILNGPTKLTWPNQSTNSSAWYNASSIQVNATDDYDEAIPSSPVAAQSLLQYSTSASSFPATGTWTGTSIPSTGIPVSEGTNTIYIGAMDQAGNTAATATYSYPYFGPYTFKIDTTPPSISLKVGTSTIPSTSTPQTSSVTYLNSGNIVSGSFSTGLSGIASASPTYSCDSGAAQPIQFASGSTTTTTSKIGQLSGFLENGLRSYVVTLNNNAVDSSGNPASLTQYYYISYSSQPGAFPLMTSSTATTCQYFFPYANGQAGTSAIGSTAISANSVCFSIPSNNFGTPPSYAPPSLGTGTSGGLTYYLDENTAATRSFSPPTVSNPAYISSSIDISGLGDGTHTLSFMLTDQSGATSSGTITFYVHRAPPAAVTLSEMTRGGSGAPGTWAYSNSLSGWTISRDSVSAVTGTNGDGITLSQYSDPSYSSTAGYACTVTDDHVTPGTVISSQPMGSSASYSFTWGQETYRTITFTITSDSGVIMSTPVVLVKPQWASLGAPVKVDAGGNYTVQWTDPNPALLSGDKAVFWGTSSDSMSTVSVETQVGSNWGITLGETGLQVGTTTLFYQDIVNLVAPATGSSTNTLLPPIQVQGPPAQTYQIPYDTLSQNLSPVSLSGVAAYLGPSGTVSVPSLAALLMNAANKGDGTQINDTMYIGIDDGGVLTKSAIVNQSSVGQFAYSLWSYFGVTPSSATAPTSADLASLNAAVAGKTLDLRLDCWYLNPSSPPSTSSSTYLLGIIDPVTLDLTVPSVSLTGYYNNTNNGSIVIPTSSSAQTLTGTASAGASGVASLTVTITPLTPGNPATPGTPWSYTVTNPNGGTTWTISSPLQNGDGSTNLPNEEYQIQVSANNGAGVSSSTVTVTRVFDNTAPTLTSLSVSSGYGQQTVSPHAYFTDANGNLVVTLNSGYISVNGVGGTGLASFEYQWTEPGAASSSTAWVNGSLPAYESNGFTGFLTAQSTTVTIGGAPTGVGQLHIKLVDQAGNVSTEYTDPTWLASYNPNLPPLTKVDELGLQQVGVAYYLSSPANLTVAYESSSPVATGYIQWNLATVNRRRHCLSRSLDAMGKFGNSVSARHNDPGQRSSIRSAG